MFVILLLGQQQQQKKSSSSNSSRSSNRCLLRFCDGLPLRFRTKCVIFAGLTCSFFGWLVPAGATYMLVGLFVFRGVQPKTMQKLQRWCKSSKDDANPLNRRRRCCELPWFKIRGSCIYNVLRITALFKTFFSASRSCLKRFFLLSLQLIFLLAVMALLGGLPGGGAASIFLASSTSPVC